MSKLNLDLENILKEYTDDVISVTNKAIEETSKETLKLLKSISPKRKRGANRYAKGWSIKKEKNSLGITRCIIYNKDRYQLTHLLEKGHINRDGSRTRSYPHISIAEEQAIDKLERKVMEEL